MYFCGKDGKLPIVSDPNAQPVTERTPHVRRIRKAIDKDGWTYIQTAHGMGYRFEAIREDD